MSSKDEQAKDEKAPAKDNKKLFIIIGAVAAAVVIAVAVLMFTGGKSGEAKDKPGEEKVEKKAEGGKEGEKGGEKGAVANVYPLEPFIVNIYDGQEIRYLKVKVEFEIAGAEVKGEMDARQAPLRDAILVLLTTKTLQDIQDLQGKNQLREEILAAANRIAPPGKVTKVYFTDFVVQ
ncbi:MAG: flagellar FliL [Geobacteraceae bacterium]|nr:MAG: flagellar FliL [Geobacteraceae bacterium]